MGGGRKPKAALGPCIQCGWHKCRSVNTWACFRRSYTRALDQHGFVRCGQFHRTLNAAEVEMIPCPTTGKYDIWYAAGWAFPELRSEAEGPDAATR